MTTSRATVAVLSIGQMGLGIASLLLAHDFRVITNVSDRSAATQSRAQSAGIQQLDSDIELVQQADYILSIVPPKDARGTAQRIVDAVQSGARKDEENQLWFLDLNAGSPDTATSLAALFAAHAPDVVFVDGGIIGGPPALQSDKTWSRPGIPLSGPHALSASSARLADVLNTRHIAPAVGSASGLKACFAALTKGWTALALQSYTTAANLHVLPELEHYLQIYNPSAKEKAEKTIVGCTGKAYRWVEEMHQIGATFGVQGGFGEQARVFREIAGVYQSLADVAEKQGGGLDSAEGVVGALGAHLKSQSQSQE